MVLQMALRKTYNTLGVICAGGRSHIDTTPFLQFHFPLGHTTNRQSKANFTARKSSRDSALLESFDFQNPSGLLPTESNQNYDTKPSNVAEEDTVFKKAILLRNFHFLHFERHA